LKFVVEPAESERAGKVWNTSTPIRLLELLARVIASDTCAVPQNTSFDSFPTEEPLAVNSSTVVSPESSNSTLFNTTSLLAITEKIRKEFVGPQRELGVFAITSCGAVKRFIATPTFDSSKVALALLLASPIGKVPAVLVYCVSVFEKYWSCLMELHDPLFRQLFWYDMMVRKH